MFWLRDQVCRFGELRRKIPGNSERMLTQQLRGLEDDGIVHRKVYPVVLPKGVTNPASASCKSE